MTDEQSYYVRGKDGPVNLKTGKPVSIAELMANGALFLSIRVEDLPEPAVPSIQLTCEECGKQIWCDMRIAEDARKLIATCLTCARPRLHEAEHEQCGDNKGRWVEHLIKVHQIPAPPLATSQVITLQQIKGLHDHVHEQEKEEE